MKLRHLYRPQAHPSIALPLNVRSVGDFRLGTGMEYRRKVGWFVELFWCCQGKATAVLKEERIPIKSGDVFLYFPGEFHHFNQVTGPCFFRWLTLDGPHTQMMLDILGLSRIHEAGTCPSEYFSELEAAMVDITAMGERRASMVAYNILLLATASTSDAILPEQQERSIEAAKALLDREFANPHLNISSISQKVSLHRSSLYRLFQQRYGISPIQYLMRLRITQALALLKETNLPINEISEKSGFSNAAYFSSKIRAVTGHNPRDFRNF